MQTRDLQFHDPEVKTLFRAITAVLSNVSTDNMKINVLTGTTNSSADTLSKFKHNLGTVPSMWIPLEGRTYVPRNGLSETEIDLRSPVASEAFKIIVIA